MGKEKSEKISNSVKSILRKNHLLTLSTLNGKEPYSNTAFYSFDKDMNLYIWSEEYSTHSKNMKKNRKVSVNIFDSKQKWGSLLQGLQATGIAEEVKRNELIGAGLLYLKRFPKALKMVKNPAKLHDKIFESKIYRIKLEEIKVFDEKSFGKGGSRKISLERK